MTQVPHGEVDQIVNIGLRDVVSFGAVLEVHVFMATVDMFASACPYGTAPKLQRSLSLALDSFRTELARRLGFVHGALGFLRCQGLPCHCESPGARKPSAIPDLHADLHAHRSWSHLRCCSRSSVSLVESLLSGKGLWGIIERGLFQGTRCRG